MLNKFKNYIKQNNLMAETDKILLAVSGGADSIVLTHLCVQCNFNIALAHCNFHLRGDDSNADEIFVKQFAEKYDIKAHFTNFDTYNYAKKNKLSIEMAARELRYSWFNELLERYKYKYIATGHHLNDSIETLFLNLTRGTGYKGIAGISNKRENVIRPLLFATRNDIEDYAKQNNLTFCTDATNNSEEFVRNKIRKKIIPVLKEINPAFESVMSDNFQKLGEATTILDYYFDIFRKNNLTTENNIEIPFDKIFDPKAIHLYELLYKFGFSVDTINKLAEAINLKKQSGAVFFSDTHKLLTDRNSFIISKITTLNNNCYTINRIEDFCSSPLKLKANYIDIQDFTLVKNKNTACLDAEKVRFPLTIRTWQQGDVFYPLGMANKKKVSDFLINNKINRFEKENTWVILNKNKEIIWVINNRIDNRFKVTKKTNSVIIIKYEN